MLTDREEIAGFDAVRSGVDVRRMPDYLLPQPPPDVPAPPPSEQALQSRRKMGGIIWIGVGAILILLALPLFRNQ
ncbi:MAG TPA: hypothetical protein VF258_10095, partial [Luteolibacter sp.]